MDEESRFLEWMGKVLADPDERTFSLLPGTPVNQMIISPPSAAGADCICVAIRKGVDAATVCNGAMVQERESRKLRGQVELSSLPVSPPSTCLTSEAANGCKAEILFVTVARVWHVDSAHTTEACTSVEKD
jgi:hypothetical protein